MFMHQNQEKTELNALLEAIPGRRAALNCIGFSGADKAYAISRIHAELRKPVVVVASSPKMAQQLCGDLTFFFRNDPDGVVAYFPPYNLLPFKFLASHNETAAARIRTLYHLTQRERPPVVVTTVAALMKKIIPKRALVDYAELVLEGEEVERDGLIKKLVSGGFVSTAIVEEPGDFCVRGGILDIFSPMYADPFRIELFGDFVESIRFFSAASQRTRENIKEAVVIPAKEVILGEEQKKAVIARIRKQGALQGVPVTEVRRMVARVREEGVFNGIESLLGLVYPGLDTLFEYFSDQSLWVSADSEALEQCTWEAHEQVMKNYESAMDDGTFVVKPGKMYLDRLEVQEKLAQRRPLAFKTLPVFTERQRVMDQSEPISFRIEENTLLMKALRNPADREQAVAPLIKWLE